MIVFLFMAVKEIHKKLSEVFSLFNEETLSGSGEEEKWTAVRLRQNTTDSSIIQTQTKNTIWFK